MSEFKLLLLANPELSFIKENISKTDLNRLINWFNKYCTNNKFNKDQIIEIFIWLFTEARRVADYNNPEFDENFEKKAEEFGIEKNNLITMFFYHNNVLEDEGFIRKPEMHSIDNKRGSFIVFEGLDGSGKSSQINELSKKLRAIGKMVSVTAEPTNGATGGLIRDTLSNNYKRNATELAALFLADRISHNLNPMNGIQKFLNEGINVICDRYYYSSFAYQGVEADMKWIMESNLNCKHITKPDLCIFLDVDVNQCKERVDQERASLEIFESNYEIMAKVRQSFFEVFRILKDSEKIEIIDANKSFSNVSEEIFKKVIHLL